MCRCIRRRAKWGQNRGAGTVLIFLYSAIGRANKNCSGPENRDASISSCKHIANAMIFSTVFDPFRRFRAPRSIEASASIDSASKKRRSISVQKCTARQQKKCSGPENRGASILVGRHTLVIELKCTLNFLRVCFLEGNRTCNQRGAAFLYRHVFAIRTVAEMDPQLSDC